MRVPVIVQLTGMLLRLLVNQRDVICRQFLPDEKGVEHEVSARAQSDANTFATKTG